MAKYTSNYSGIEIDQGIGKAFEDIGDAYFDSTTNQQYLFKSTDDKLAWLGGDNSIQYKVCAFEFTGTINKMTVVNYMDSKNLYYTQVSKSAVITVGFKSEEKGITDTSWSEIIEDARITVEIDRGVTGKYETIVSEQLVLNGNTLSVDIIRYLATGNSRVRITATGVDTGSTNNIVYTVLLTSMYLAPAKFAWNVPFIEGQAYSLGGLYIGGNIDKILKIKVSNEQTYSKLYEINRGTQTDTSIAYYYEGLEFPTEGTGIYTVEMWLDANGLESEHLHYNIMCIAKEDVRTAQLIAVSDVLSTVKNYDTNKIFSYAVYNGGATTANPIVNVSAIINNTPTIITSDEELSNIPTGEINDYIVDLEIDTQESNVQLYSSIELGDCKQEAVYAVDNSASYPAISGAEFYLNPANRNNTQSNKEVIINESNLANIPTEYTATWSGVSFVDGMDGWTTDNYGRKCLRLPAKSKVEIAYAPFANASTRTLEVAYRVENASDYNEDIISIASDLTSQFVGARIKPTNVLLHSVGLRTDDLMQGYNTKDEEFVHLLITVIRNYKQIGNLAQIYVNGVKKCSFEWSAGDTFAHNGTINFGSNTADLYIYKTKVYKEAFDWVMAAQNFISCLPDTASKKAAYNKLNSVLNDGNKIDFDKVKNTGLNYFTLRLPNGAQLPSIISPASVPHSRLEINIQQNPSFIINGVYEDETTEGQGTTAMNYWDWNLRWKTSKVRITAKRNWASSMHSHKMGGTALFNDLYGMIVGANEVNGRVAVEQYPAYGFLEVLKEGTTDQFDYIPIGLYTIGQDKGDKPTFGYNHPDYKDTLIHMEGTDHSPKAVGMDYPWNKLNVATNTEGDANLGVQKADGSVVAAWEIGACGKAKTDAAMFEYLTQEFKPAYDCDYLNTSMIIGLDKGITIDDVNENLSAFRALETDNGYTAADCLVWIDGEYETYYYDVLQEKYVKDGVNILTDLGITASDLSGTTAEEKNREIRMRRMMRYRETMENYWHLRDNLFHYCFIVLFAATDNFKKNTYPYKFGTLASGSRWRWRQDDLDTLFDINNQGLANKIYSILNGDKSGTTHLFRGNTSYHWTNIQFYYENEIKSMMREILTAMASLGEGNSLIEKAIDCIRKYFWDKAQDYFTKSAYNIDAEAYEEAWAAMKNGTYKAPVHPLQQSLGDHYEAERAFVELRFLFIASLYGFGAFAVGNDSDTSLGQISFRPAQGDNTFHLTPAINMNPTILVGDSDSKSAGERLNAGETADITVSTDGDTSIYIQGTDYLSDIGDFSKINLYAENPLLIVSGKRLQKLKVGDENPNEVTTLLKTLNVLSCPSIEEIDARNVTTLTGTIDLSQCPRLTKALFGRSNATEIALPKGSKITEFELPDSLTNLSLVNLPNLTNIPPYISCDLVWTNGHYIDKNNSTQWNAEYRFCDYVKIDDAKRIIVDGYFGTDNGLHFYTKDKSVISFVDSTALGITSNIQSYDNIIEVPQNAVYVRMSGRIDATLKIIRETGSTGGLKYGDLTALTYLRVENNANIEGFAMLKATYKAGSPLTNIRVIGFDYDGTADDVTLLATLANGNYFGIDADGSRNNDIIPVIEGTLNVAGSIYKDDADVINEKYGRNLVLNVTGGYYVKFADPEVQRICAENWGDGMGITTEQIEAVTDIGTKFRGNTTIESFDEFERFIGVSRIGVRDVSTASFYNCNNLKQIKLPPSLTEINPYSFASTGLLEVPNLENVAKLNSYVFENTPNMRGDVIINITYIADGVFCKSGIDAVYALKATKIAETSNSASAGSFSRCANLEKVVLGEALLFIGTSAFYDCVKLKELLIPSSVTTIKTNAFYNCTSLEIDDLSLPNLETLGQNAFYGVKIKKISNLGKITTLPTASKTTQNFGDRSVLEEIELPEGVKALNYDFYGYNNLKKVVLAAPVSIGTGTFRNCSALSEITWENILSLGEDVFRGCSSLPSIINMPNMTGSIGAGTFEGNKSIVEFTATATKLTGYVFNGCTALKKVVLPNATLLNSAVFNRCSALETVILGAIESFVSDVFFACTKLKTVMINNSTPPSLSRDAFNQASSTFVIYVPDASVEAYKSASGWSAYADRIKPLSEYVES